jgi:hypothetical protein
MAATIVQSGSYDLKIATGFLVDAFTLDDPVKGLLDSTEYVLDGSTEFASVIDGATGISVFRGRRDIGDQFTAGTMSFDLNDTFTGGIFNPFDTQSPYYDTAQAVPGLAPMRKVVLSREGEELFNGYIVDYSYNFNLGGLDTVSVACADDFYLLSQTYMDEFNVTEQLASARVAAVLNLPEVNAFMLPVSAALQPRRLRLAAQLLTPFPTAHPLLPTWPKLTSLCKGASLSRATGYSHSKTASATRSQHHQQTSTMTAQQSLTTMWASRLRRIKLLTGQRCSMLVHLPQRSPKT